MMKSDNSSGDRISATDQCGVDLSLLKAEISFWQEMIRFRDSSMTDESLERMQQALALAQTKLNDSVALTKTRRGAATVRSGNVYCLNDRRK